MRCRRSPIAAGEPTGALFGVVNMLRANLKDRPEYVAVRCRCVGPTFRDELYPDYKAHRPPMPDDLRAQIEPMLAMVEALGLPILRVPGVEADDVIGTLAQARRREGIDVVDFDRRQGSRAAGRPRTSSLVNTMTNTTLDEAGVFEKFGVRPDQIVDYLALIGDSADNIPGVRKVRPENSGEVAGRIRRSGARHRPCR